MASLQHLVFTRLTDCVNHILWVFAWNPSIQKSLHFKPVQFQLMLKVLSELHFATYEEWRNLEFALFPRAYLVIG